MELTGIIAPFLFYNYGECNLKVQFLNRGENGFFSNISASAFGGVKLGISSSFDINYGGSGGLSVGTFSRRGSHEFEIATNIQTTSFFAAIHHNSGTEYKSYLIGLGSGYTFWKEGGAKFYSVELGTFYNFSRSYKGYEYVAYLPISYSVDGNNMNTTGIPFTISLSVKGGF